MAAYCEESAAEFDRVDTNKDGELSKALHGLLPFAAERHDAGAAACAGCSSLHCMFT